MDIRGLGRVSSNYASLVQKEKLTSLFLSLHLTAEGIQRLTRSFIPKPTNTFLVCLARDTAIPCLIPVYTHLTQCGITEGLY